MTDNLFASEPAPGADWITAHCDGGSRGNPGPAGFGAVIEDADGQVLAKLSEFLGRQTNNYAEYAGLLAALKWAHQYQKAHLRVVSDSELMVRQMKGEYKVASPALRLLWEEARSLARKLKGFEIRHTLRGGNKEADRLANQAMDRGMGKDSGASGVSGASGASEPAGQQATKPAHPGPSKAPQQVLDGFVKGGVIHLLDGELPDGTFVKVIKE
jgi:probable phosphoglycerate mutase